MASGQMSEVSAIERARQAFDRKAWTDAYRLFEAAHHEAPLEPEDLERRAMTAYLLGSDVESERFIEQAHRRYLHEVTAKGPRDRHSGWDSYCMHAEPGRQRPGGKREPKISWTRAGSTVSCAGIC